MADAENYTSMLPQPSRPGGIPRALSEITQSENNLRNTMPPPTTGHKRHGSHLPEPAAKRKTLVERAGEPIRPNGSVQGSYSLYRPSANLSSSYRSNSSASRQTSNASLSGSLNSGIRAPSTQTFSGLARPKIALAKDKAAKEADIRPASSHGLQSLSQETAKKQALDADEHYTNFKRMFEDYQVLYKQTLGEAHEARNANSVYTSTIERLEQERSTKTDTIIALASENETFKYRLEHFERQLMEQRKEHETIVESLRAQHFHELETSRHESKDELIRAKEGYMDEVKALRKTFEQEMETERTQRMDALNQASAQGTLERQRQQMELEMKEQEVRSVKAEVERVSQSLEREKVISDDLRKNLADAGQSAASADSTRHALQAKIEFLESDSKSQSESYANMERRMNEAFTVAEESLTKLRKEETLRRKLHNQVQELKGNIRVFCRVRPTLPTEEPEELAAMNFPDADDFRDVEVKGQEEKSSLGKITTKTHAFSFDRVFDPTSNNTEIFAEISQLIQSALDGYNVCIFAYGQTGSGKTYTMSSDDGMIPEALRQIYTTSRELQERGWKYTMEGSFVEVYNEEIRDLLGDGSENKKHEVRHDMNKCETTITDVNTIMLDSQAQVESILEKAMAKRSVAATKANERSSRSHSVFILKLNGYNSITGETSKGTLNLVDLAGSERLSHSKVEGQRLKETQSINKSLSCLGDVIGALGQAGPGTFDPKASINGSSTTSHIPYRNSKLTYLLQFSLGGNSKTLMFVMVAPEKKCLGETLTSLKFAEKVSNTKVGVARRFK